MPPVSGLLAPTDRRPPLGAEVPPSVPGAKTSLLPGPERIGVCGDLAYTIA